MTVRFNSFYIKGKQGKQLQFKLPELVSANLVLPKTSKMAMICLQVESSENNPIISSSNASDICFRSLFVCEFLKRRISYVHSILQPTQLIQPNGKSKVEIRRERKSSLTPASERIVPTEGPDLDVHPQL